jgi:hypothetical protein
MCDRDVLKFLLPTQRSEERLTEVEQCDRPSAQELERDRFAHLLLAAWALVLEEEQAAGSSPRHRP